MSEDEGGGDLSYNLSDNGGDIEGGFHIDMDEPVGSDRCLKCGENRYKILDGHLVCKNCGTENTRHALNATLEY